jgi:CheY-like chemotaxis protein
MGKKILLADDSLTIQKVVELTLAGTDYELTCVSNGQMALESLQHSRPDLILADVVMPGKNGYEVCEAVKRNPATARIPVLLLSGTFEPFDRDRADRIAADRVISKPFDAQHLLDQIETLLNQAADAPASDSTASQERPFENAFLDDTIPTPRSAHRSEAIEPENPFETASPVASAEGKGLPADRSSEAKAKEEASARAGASVAEMELSGAEEFSGGPVFLPIAGTQAAPEEPETRHPVEEAPLSEPPHKEAGLQETSAAEEILFEVSDAATAPAVEPSGEEAGIEEISAEEAEAFFDLSAVATPAPPASPASPLPAVFELTEEQIERIAALVVAKLSDRVLREIAWEVIPDVAETVVKRRIEELEGSVE